MPPGLIDQEHRMGSWCDHLGDFREMQVHCFGVAGRQDQGRALALFGTNGTEDVGRSGALIAGSTRTGAAFGVRRAKAALSSGCKSHPATAPAGSNRSSYGGNEMAEAFG